MKRNCDNCQSFSPYVPCGRPIVTGGFCVLEYTCYDWVEWSPAGLLVIWDEVGI